MTWLRDEDHKQAYVELVSRLASYPPVILGTDLGRQLQGHLRPAAGPAFLARLQKGVDFAAEQRLIRKPFQVSDWVEPRFLDAALKEQVQASR